jgi:hypothetical protein
MPEPDPFHLAANYALGHKVTHCAFRKFWRSLDERDRERVAQDVGDHFKLSNFVQGPPIPLATSDQFPRIKNA